MSNINLDALYAPPRPIAIGALFTFHEVPVMGDVNTRVLFQQWLNANLPSTAVSTTGANGAFIIGLAGRDTVVARPGEFVRINIVTGETVRFSLLQIIEQRERDWACRVVLLTHEQRRVVRMLTYVSALVDARTLRTKIQPLLNALVPN
jgi:hypothetical protein